MATKTSKDNLQLQLSKLRLEYAQVRLDVAINKTKNTNAHKPIKKRIAQLLSLINQKKQ